MRASARPSRARTLDRWVRFGARTARTLWLRERGVAELRWATVTLAAMVVLGLIAVWLDPAGGDFDRLLVVAIPPWIVLGLVAWSPIAVRVARRRAVRLALGPLVLLVAIAGTGPANLTDLARPSAAPTIVLAMAFAAMTPGYLVAAAILGGASIGVFVAHTQVITALDLTNQVNDEYVVGVIVTLLASAGMAVVVRVATDAEARATRLAAQSRQRVDVLETLNRIVSRFDGSRPVRSVIQEVVDDIAREMEITLVSIYLPLGDGRLEMVGVAGYPTPIHVIEVGFGIIGRAAATKTTQFARDVLIDPDYRAARSDVRSEVAAPVVHSGELLGVVNFEGTLDHPIGATQVALAEMVAHTLSGALRSARFDDERRHRLQAIEGFVAASRSLVADLDRPRIVEIIVAVAAEQLRADIVALFSRGPDGTFRLEAGSGFPVEAVGFELPTGEGLLRRSVAGRVRMTDVLTADKWPPEYRANRPGGDAPHAAMGLPIEVGGEVSAILLLTRVGADRAYTELDGSIADLLSAQVAIALQNADLHAQVAESAVRDPLTGLLNRRYFDEAVETAFAAARRSGTELSLIVLDLDRFSDVNNEHGHTVGDGVLRRVARAMSAAVRTSDIVARYGGEEFVIIAPGSSQNDAVALAERIRLAVATEARRPVEGLVVPLTISAGVASRLGDEADGRALFRAADSALLAAKRAGRDRVVTL